METKDFSPGAPSREDPAAADRAAPNVDALTWSAEDYASSSQADGTRRTYDKSWRGFEAWCAEQGFCALPAAPQTVALFLAARADQGRRPATLSVTLSAIAQAHELAGHPSPTADLLVKKTWKGVRRRLGIAPNKKDPISASELRSMMDKLPAGLLGLRDRALLLLGFAGGFRRSELVALNRRDLTFVSEGLEAFVTNSKTDQEGKGHIKMIAYGSDPSTCPVRAAKDWLELSGINDGPVFRPIDRYEKLGAKALTDHAVAVIIKRTATRAGLATPELSGHSLRAGFVTEAARNGADYPSIMDQTGHENLTTVHGYNRRKDKWKKPASAKLGL